MSNAKLLPINGGQFNKTELNENLDEHFFKAN